MYLQRKHLNSLEEYKALVEQLRKTYPSKTGPSKLFTCKFNQKLFFKDVANYIFKTGAPFSTVEEESFRQIFDSEFSFLIMSL